MGKCSARPDLMERPDCFHRSVGFADTKRLPSRVDLRPGCSPVVDQGSLGACTAHAIVSGLREYLLLKEKQPFTRLSRLFFYYQVRARRGMENRDCGGSLREGMKVLQTIGVCPENKGSYNATQLSRPPTAREIAAAAPFKIKAYRLITNLAMLKAAIAAGFPVVASLRIFEAFKSEVVAQTGMVPIPAKIERCVGGHAVCIVGYDDSHQWCIVRNCWGAAWGNKGYFYLPYQFIKPALVVEMWTSEG